MLNKNIFILCLSFAVLLSFSILVDAASPDEDQSTSGVYEEVYTEDFLKKNVPTTGITGNRPGLIKDVESGKLTLLGDKKWVAKKMTGVEVEDTIEVEDGQIVDRKLIAGRIINGSRISSGNIVNGYIENGKITMTKIVDNNIIVDDQIVEGKVIDGDTFISGRIVEYIEVGKKIVIRKVALKKTSILETRLDQNIYIYDCKDTTIIIPSTLAHIELQNCENVTVRFPSVVSSAEISDCQNITINCYNNIPTIQLDRTERCKIYLPVRIPDPDDPKGKKFIEVADKVIISHSQCKNLTLNRVLQVNGKPAHQPITIPDSDMMRSGQNQTLENESESRYGKAPEAFLTRLEPDVNKVWATNEAGKMIKNEKNELVWITQVSDIPGKGGLLSVARFKKDEKGKLLSETITRFKKDQNGNDLTDSLGKRIEESRIEKLILEEKRQWMWIKRFKKSENGQLIPDPNGGWIWITRNASELKDAQGYIILPENNIFPTMEELIKLQLGSVPSSEEIIDSSTKKT